LHQCGAVQHCHTLLLGTIGGACLAVVETHMLTMITSLATAGA